MAHLPHPSAQEEPDLRESCVLGPARGPLGLREMSGFCVVAGDQTSHPGAVHQDHHHVALRLHRRLLRDAQPALRRLRGGLPAPDPRQRLRLQLHHVRGENSEILNERGKFLLRKVDQIGLRAVNVRIHPPQYLLKPKTKSTFPPFHIVDDHH